MVIFLRQMFLGAILFVAPSFVYATELTSRGYLPQLEKTDDLRLSNFKAFQQELLRLDEYSSGFNADEADYLNLLKASEATLLSNYHETPVLLQNLLYRPTNDVLRVRALALLVNSHVLAQNYANAFEYFEMLLAEGHQLTDEKALVQRLGVIALLYIKLEKFDLAQHYLRDIHSLALSDINLCRLYTQKIEAMSGQVMQQDFDRESEFGFSLCQRTGEQIAAGFIVAEIIRYNVAQQRFTAAIGRYESYRDVLYTTNYSFLIAKVNALASKAYFAENNMPQAESLAREALLFSDTYPLSLPVILAAKSLYEIAKSQSRFQDSLKYLELLNDAKTSYEKELSSQLLAYHLARGEIEVKNQRIALLDKDNELLSLQRNIYAQEVRQHKLIMLLLFFILIVASFIAYRGMSGRKRFKRIAEFDQLTGISNRYHFNNLAKVALDYCELNTKPAALILFDLDYFKTINDNYGHASGDWALQQVVKTCRNFMRNNDVFGRIGGEEFAVVLPGCHVDKAALLAEICRDAIATIDTTESGYTFPLSASFGVSSSDTSGYQLKQLLADADLAMYRAKQSGRDQIATYSHLMDKAD